MRKNMFSKFCVLLFTLTALCSIDAISQIPEYLPRNGLVGWWPLNGNATDESGNGNDGVVYGAKSQKNRFDQPASSLELNGKSDYIVMKKNGPLGSDSRTVSVWVKTNDVSTSIIVSWGYGSEGSDFNLWSNYSCNGITLDINHSAKTYNSKFTNGDWNHYVVVYDKSIGSKLSAVVVYENGKVLDSKCAETGYGVINTGLGFPITLGKYHARNSEYLEGIIDDLAVWNRSLTPIEVSELYYSSNNPDKNKVNPITLDDKSDLIKSENEHKGVNKGTTNYYDTDLDTTNANKDNQLEVILQFPKYIVCEESEYYNFDKESLFGDEGAPGGLRFFTVAIDRFGNKKKLDTNSSFLEQHVLLFEDMSGDPEKKRIPDFYKTIGNYWKPDIAQSGDKDVRELNKKLQNKYFRLVLVPISCESQYDENGLALEYKRDMKGNIIPGTRPKGKTEVRYYVKSIEEVTIITKSLGISNKDKGVLSTVITKKQTTKPINDKSKKIENIDLSVSATKIGNQYWMTQNLSVTKFRNGINIPFAKNIKEWSDYYTAKQPAYCYERFDEKYKGKGYYYNTWAICDSNLAPPGWRVPSKDNFLQLGKSLGRDAHLKLKSKDQWEINRVYGNFNGNNKSGFNAYPNYLLTGYFDYTGYEDLDYISRNGYFEGFNEAHFGITCSDEYFQLGNGYTSFPWGFDKITLNNDNVGLMIRCVK